jgi:hypothetical protein
MASATSRLPAPTQQQLAELFDAISADLPLLRRGDHVLVVALMRFPGNVSRAARWAGCSRDTLHRRLRCPRFRRAVLAGNGLWVRWHLARIIQAQGSQDQGNGCKRLELPTLRDRR